MESVPSLLNRGLVTVAVPRVGELQRVVHQGNFGIPAMVTPHLACTSAIVDERAVAVNWAGGERPP